LSGQRKAKRTAPLFSTDQTMERDYRQRKREMQLIEKVTTVAAFARMPDDILVADLRKGSLGYYGTKVF
jgi:hypothetical protein